MKKKPNLQAALAEPKVESAPTEQPPASPALAKTVRPDRANKTNLTAYFPKPVKWELQALALDRSRQRGRKVTLQDLLGEALNDLFKKYQRPELCPVDHETDQP